MSFIPVFGLIPSLFVCVVLLAAMGWLSIRFVRERPYTDSTVGMIIRR